MSGTGAVITPHLFVYGTLMTSATGALGHAQRERLRREAAYPGPATMAGRLWDLGRCPGLVAGEEPDAVVHGEVFALLNPRRALRWLDAYEGIVPGLRARSEYRRIARPVRLATGEQVTAWVYIYVRDIAHARALPSGRWTSSL